MKFHFNWGRTKMHLAQLKAALLILANLSFGCNDIYPQTIHLKVDEPLFVPCPNATEDEMTFKLSYNKHQIGNKTFNRSQSKHQQNAPEMGTDLRVNLRNDEAHFVISSVKANSTGIYGCEAEVLFPPPYRKLTARLIAVFVEEPCQLQGPTLCLSQSTPTFFWWPIGYGILGFYCLVMTCITAVLWHKLKIKQCLQNDYMNMKPGGFRKRPRVQHPAIMGRY